MMMTYFLAVGCGTFVNATLLNDPPRPLQPRQPFEVEIYSSSPPSRPHVDVALLTVEQTESLNRQGTSIMLRELRQKAAEIGCDAVFISGRSERDGAHSGSGWDPFAPGSHSIHGTCLVYENDGDRADPDRPMPRRPR